MTDDGTQTSDREFEREKVAFEQNHRFFSDVQRLATQIMLISVSVDGGILYALGTLEGVDPWLKQALLALGALINGAFIWMLRTCLAVMRSALKKIEGFHPGSFPSLTPEENPYVYRYSVVNVVAVVLAVIAAMFVVVAVLNPFERARDLQPLIAPWN